MNSTHSLQHISRIEIGRVCEHESVSTNPGFFTRDIRFVGEDGTTHTLTLFAHDRTGLTLHMVKQTHLAHAMPITYDDGAEVTL